MENIWGRMVGRMVGRMEENHAHDKVGTKIAYIMPPPPLHIIFILSRKIFKKIKIIFCQELFPTLK